MRLASCELDDPAFLQLLPHLRNCSGLARLDLSFNRITIASLDALAAAWLQPSTSHLTELYLGNTWMGDAGALSLATALQGNPSLRRLDIANQGARPQSSIGRDTSQSGVLALARALSVHMILVSMYTVCFIPKMYLCAYIYIYIFNNFTGKHSVALFERHVVRRDV